MYSEKNKIISGYRKENAKSTYSWVFTVQWVKKKKKTNSRLKEGPETKRQGMYPKKDK